MASGAQQAQFLFPTGTDIYSTKVDRGTVISGEGPYTVPGSPYNFYLEYVPQSGTISIGGWTEVFTTPTSAGQFQATYSGANAGLLQFWAGDAGNPITGVSYTAYGDIARAFYFNDLQQSVVTIENFIQSGLGITGTYVEKAGDTMTGNLVMSGASIVPATASGSSIGSQVLPFYQAHAGEMYANSFTDEGSLNGISIDSSGNVSVLAASTITTTAPALTDTITAAVLTESLSGTVTLKAINGQVELVTPTTVFYGSATPSASGLYDLGTTGLRWATIHADNIDAPIFLSGVVTTSGSTMTGTLAVASPAGIKTNLIENYDSTLSISVTGASLAVSADTMSFTSLGNIDFTVPALSSINLGGLSVFSSATIANGSVVPSITTANLGDPSNPFDYVYANNFVGLDLSGSFVRISGDEMSGDLYMGSPSGTGTQPTIYVENINALSSDLNINVGQLAVTADSNIHFDLGPSGTQMLEIGLAQIYFSNDFIPTTDSAYDIGSPTNYVNNLYARNIHATGISGVSITAATLGNVTVTGNITMASGTAILASSSGTVNIGTSGSPFGVIYADSVVTSVGTGTYLSKFGDTIQGNLLTSGSGSNNIGSASVPFNAIYADNIVSSGLDDIYVNVAGDTMTGPLVISNISSTGSLTISGVNNLNAYFNQIVLEAEQVDITSTVGPVILDANTEFQQLVGGVAKSVVNQSGTELYDNIYPDTSGTHTVGTPTKPFAAIYADNIINTNISGTGLYVLRAGDGMYGNLTMLSGSNILTQTSGTSDIGSVSAPFNAVYADNFYLGTGTIDGAFVHITGDTMTGVLGFNGSNSIQSVGDMTYQAIGGDLNHVAMSANSQFTVNASSGITLNSFAGDTAISATSAGVSISSRGITGTMIGASSNIDFAAGSTGRVKLSIGGGNPSLNVQTDNTYMQGTSGELIKISGGTITFQGGSANSYAITTSQNVFYKNIVPSGSGSVSIGTASVPFSGLYIKNINGQAATIKVYNEVPSGTADGVNTVFTTVYTPVSGSTQLYRAGLRMTPAGVDYTQSGSTLTFVIAPASGDNILIDYDRLAF
jgi:hypothetical protein